MSELEAIDVEELKKEQEQGDSRQVKRLWIKLGFKYQMSLYGALRLTDDDRHEGRRIEILSNTAYDNRIVFMIYEFFRRIPPLARYTIWVYDGKREGIRIVGRYD